MGTSGDGERAVALISLAEAAAAKAQWLQALDLASQALAADPSQAAAAALVGTARQRLGTLSRASAELRPITVVAIDMYRSTTIAARLGPERMRELMLEVYEVCVDAVSRYDGRVTKYTGDGVLAQFGYPVAHEDDARRAVLAALAALEGIEARAASWEERLDEQVMVRIGIDSGVAAIGPVDASPFSAEEIAGDPPNVATRVQASAERMTIRITESTRRLIEGWFVTEPVGAVELRNYPYPLALHSVIGPTEAETRLEASGRSRPPLLGREAELAVLRGAWNQVAASGERRIVTVTGEPGIGKSRLVEHVVATAIATRASHLTFACSRLYRDSALRPVGRALARFFGVLPANGDTDTIVLDAIRRGVEQFPGRRLPTEVSVPVYGWLVGVRSAVDLEPEELRRRAFDAVIDLLEAMAASSNLVLCADDLDFADPSTFELLTALVSRKPVPMLVVLTGRRPLTSPAPPDLGIELRGLAADDARALVDAVAPDLDPAHVEEIIARSNGVPFFLEEQARSARAAPERRPDQPGELTAFLAARLDELGPEARQLLGEVAVAGEEVRLDVLAGLASAQLDRLEPTLERLQQQNVVIRRSGPAGEVVRFRHGLMREAAYAGLLEARRGELHRRLAGLLDELPSGTVAPEDLARHYELGGEGEQAADRWLEAGRLAATGGANTEAIELFRRSLGALAGLPESTARSGIEIQVQLGLGNGLATQDGYTSPDARAAFERAMALAESLGDRATAFPALWGIAQYWFVLGEHEINAGLVARMRRIAEEQDDPRFGLEAAHVIGYRQLYRGEFEAAREQLDRASRHVGLEPVADYPQDVGIVSRSTLAIALWFLGEAEASRKAADDALALAASLDPSGRRAALTECWVSANLAWRAELAGDSHAAIELADRAAAVATEHRYATWLGAATLHRSIAQCRVGQIDEGLPTLAAMVEAWRSAGRDATGRQLHPVLMTPYFAGRLAEALLAAGRIDEAAAELDRVLTDTAANGERFWNVELLRLRAGVARLRRTAPEIIRRDLEAARRLAAEQGARSLVDTLDDPVDAPAPPAQAAERSGL